MTAVTKKGIQGIQMTKTEPKQKELFEVLLPEFFDADALHVPAEITYRVDNQGERLYARATADGMRIVPSVTTILRLMPKGDHLMKWAADNFNSYDESREFVQIRAEYGTFMHILFKEILLGNTLSMNVDALGESFKNHLESIGASAAKHDLKQVGRDLRQDLFAFVKFCLDYKVRPLAIEYIVFGEKYAGAADLVCKMTLRSERTIKPKGTFEGLPFMRYDSKQPGEKVVVEEKEIIALLDFKSGRKGFHDDNVLQLHALRELWNAERPEHPIERIYNFGCKNYRLPLGKSEPYNLKDQSKNEELFKKWPLLVDLYHTEEIIVKDKVDFMEFGQISLSTPLDKLIVTTDLLAVITEKAQEKNNGNTGQNTENKQGNEIASDRSDKSGGKGKRKRPAKESRLF